MDFSNKIWFIEFHNLDIHQLYILYWQHIEKLNLKIFFHTFQYIFIIKGYIFKFSLNLLNGLKNGLQRKNRFTRALHCAIH